MVFKCAVDKTLITFNELYLKVYGGFFYRCYLYKRIQVLIVLSLSDSSASSQNLVFSCDGCQDERLHVSKKKGRYQERGLKKERGADTPFHTLSI